MKILRMIRQRKELRATLYKLYWTQTDLTQDTLVQHSLWLIGEKIDHSESIARAAAKVNV